MEWEVFEQHLFNAEDEPEGEGWEPFAASATVVHDGIRESLGGGLAAHSVVFWRRQKSYGED